MKRKFLLLAVAVAMVMGAKAQTATLQQGNNMTAYYGSNAFKDAYAAANSGAIITLSEGTFITVDSITKPVTIIGSGYVGSVTSISYNTLQTPITVTQNITDGSSLEVKQASLIINADNVKIDGVNFNYPVVLRTINDLHLSHCYLSELCSTGSCTNTIIDQCYVKSARCSIRASNGTVKNSFVDAMRWSGFSFLNSVVYRILYWGKDETISINGSRCRNSILGFYGYNPNIGEGCEWNGYQLGISNREHYYNCVLFLYPYTWNGSSFERVDYLASHLPCNADNLYNDNSASTWDNLFDETLPWSDPNYIKTTAVGDDGKVVGPYGGTGFSLYPSIPRITESKIDTYTDGEGKLNVKVKVEVGQ